MARQTPVYEEWKVHPIHAEKIVEKIRKSVEELKNASSADEAIKAIKGYWKVYDKFVDDMCVISLKYTLDTRDKKNIKNQEIADSAGPLVSSEVIPFAKAVLESPYRPEIEKKFGSHYLTILEFMTKSFSKDIVDLAQRENELSSRYNKLVAGAVAHFEGKDYGLGELGGFFGDPDKARRKAAHEAQDEAVREIAPELEDIYDEMVHLRDEMAKRMGFETYTDLAYFIMSRYDYGRKDVEGYREQIHEIVTPMCEKIAARSAKAMGQKRLDLEDIGLYYADGDPKPMGTTDDKVKAAMDMYDRMGEETGNFFRFMVDKHLLFLDAKPGKALGGYMEYLPIKGCPIIFSNFNGSSGDVDVLTHEFGHAFQSYLARKIKVPEFRCPTMDGAEIDSMSMEFFAWPYMDLFFDNPDKYRYQHLASAVMFLPYGATVDEFQHWVYANPNSGKEARREKWKELEEKYTPYRRKAYEGHGYLGDGLRWIMQGHIFQNPFYYIDYTLAQVVAFEFLAMDKKNHERAWKKYVKLGKLGGTLPFQHLLGKCGLVSPLSDGALKKVMTPVKKILKESEELAYK